ncbi:MarR family transcriptional regulator [Limnohabitans sp.]|uniref:MarR family winged helix-turn-helix transcriptional regulator n=1 Tax=Limnohabitans sp. TaxID=1907725 RepID=UPI00286F1FDC|nr:MarR family transcriptional regulator [Limnohabitans sp.]
MSVLDMAGHLIRRLHQQSTQIFVQRTQAAGFDLTPIQYAALEAIYENPSIDQARVAEMIGYDRATIGGVIERLEKKGWIRRLVSEQDRRARQLSLTAKGNKIRMALEPIVEDLQKDILQPLSDADQKFFINLARQIILLSDATAAGTLL